MRPIATQDQSTLLKITEEARAGHEIKADLVNQRINNARDNKLAEFEIKELRKHYLVNGLDDIGLTMKTKDKIKKFERKKTMNTP